MFLLSSLMTANFMRYTPIFGIISVGLQKVLGKTKHAL